MKFYRYFTSLRAPISDCHNDHWIVARSNRPLSMCPNLYTFQSGCAAPPRTTPWRQFTNVQFMYMNCTKNVFTWRAYIPLHSHKKPTNLNSWHMVCKLYAESAAHVYSLVHTYAHLVHKPSTNGAVCKCVPDFRSKITIFWRSNFCHVFICSVRGPSNSTSK